MVNLPQNQSNYKTTHTNQDINKSTKNEDLFTINKFSSINKTNRSITNDDGKNDQFGLSKEMVPRKSYRIQ